jgi:hypothetical protein
VSDSYLHIIPVDPNYVPDAEHAGAATRDFAKLIGGAADISTETTDDVRFVDSGVNWEGVFCPRCRADLDDWWSGAMHEAAALDFRTLTARLPCCGASVSLNDLDYPWPVGFARWSLTARDPARHDVKDTDLESLSEALGCEVCIVRARL